MKSIDIDLSENFRVKTLVSGSTKDIPESVKKGFEDLIFRTMDWRGDPLIPEEGDIVTLKTGETVIIKKVQPWYKEEENEDLVLDMLVIDYGQV